MGEQQKENARLRAAEKFMMRDTGNARCTVCPYTYSMEEGAPGTAPKNTPSELLLAEALLRGRADRDRRLRREPGVRLRHQHDDRGRQVEPHLRRPRRVLRPADRRLRA